MGGSWNISSSCSCSRLLAGRSALVEDAGMDIESTGCKPPSEGALGICGNCWGPAAGASASASGSAPAARPCPCGIIRKDDTTEDKRAAACSILSALFSRSGFLASDKGIMAPEDFLGSGASGPCAAASGLVSASGVSMGSLGNSGFLNNIGRKKVRTVGALGSGAASG